MLEFHLQGERAASPPFPSGGPTVPSEDRSDSSPTRHKHQHTHTYTQTAEKTQCRQLHRMIISPNKTKIEQE